MKSPIFSIFVFCMLLFSSTHPLHAQSLALEWAKGMGGTGDDMAEGMVVDSLGNVYITGHFSGTADFDPGSGTYNLMSHGAWDIFAPEVCVSTNCNDHFTKH